MQISRIALPGLLLTCWTLFSQGPVSDVIKVNLPHPSQVGSHLLPAGEYQIRQLPTASHPRLLEFTSPDGMKFETSITAIPTIDNNNRNETSVELEQRGDRYFVKRVWVAGKTYGYQIPFDASQPTATTPETRRLTATYETPRPEPVQVAAAKPAPEPEPVPAPAPAPEPAPAPVPEPAPVAQAEPAPRPQPAPPPARTELQELPRTAANWPVTLLGGIALLTLSVALSRIR